ncbi:hypothetical protein XENTR_v10007821 [Xenopus tropicalis]|nr:hypothetical protein XENTR_v10007821 [Xenopus tropicalis]
MARYNANSIYNTPKQDKSSLDVSKPSLKLNHGFTLKNGQQGNAKMKIYSRKTGFLDCTLHVQLHISLLRVGDYEAQS